jgi:hypothetical protein
MVERSLAQSVLFRVRVINNEQIRTTTSHRSTNTRRKVLATHARLPFSCAFVVFF